jgi:hypothetical protein
MEYIEKLYNSYKRQYTVFCDNMEFILWFTSEIRIQYLVKSINVTKVKQHPPMH